jgi:hypothetical protein
MKMIRVSALLLIGLTACARNEGAATDTAATAAAAADDRGARAAAISNAIQANPAAADSILKANNLTAEQFDRMLYDVAADSAQSAAYAAARAP